MSIDINGAGPSLRERLGSVPAANAGTGFGAARGGSIDNPAYQELKQHVHQSLLDRIDLEGMQRLSQEQIRDDLKILVGRLLEEDSDVINAMARRTLVRDLQGGVLG